MEALRGQYGHNTTSIWTNKVYTTNRPPWQQSRTEYIQSIENQLRSLEYDLREQNDTLMDMIAIFEDKSYTLTENEKEILNHSKYIASQQIKRVKSYHTYE